MMSKYWFAKFHYSSGYQIVLGIFCQKRKEVSWTWNYEVAYEYYLYIIYICIYIYIYSKSFVSHGKFAHRSKQRSYFLTPISNITELIPRVWFLKSQISRGPSEEIAASKWTANRMNPFSPCHDKRYSLVSCRRWDSFNSAHIREPSTYPYVHDETKTTRRSILRW